MRRVFQTVEARERIQAIVLVAVERAVPVIYPAYDLGATEVALRAQWLRKLTENGS